MSNTRGSNKGRQLDSKPVESEKPVESKPSKPATPVVTNHYDSPFSLNGVMVPAHSTVAVPGFDSGKKYHRELIAKKLISFE